MVVSAPDSSLLSGVQLCRLFKQFPPNQIIEVKLTHSGDIRDRIASYSELVPKLKSENFDSVLLGDLRQSWMQDIACSVESSETILLDDGAATLPIYDNFLKQSDCTLPVRLFKSSLERQTEVSLVKKQLGFDMQRKPLRIFSIFDFGDVTFAINQFSLLKRVFGIPCKKGKYWHFIGSPVVEKNLLSIAEYDAVLVDAIESQKSKGQAFYIAHRAEDLSIKKERLAELGFIIIDSEKPYEMTLLQQDDYPSAILSFHSTCLFNASILFGDKIEKICYILSADTLECLKEKFIMQNHFSVFHQIESIYRRLLSFNIIERKIKFN